MKYLITILLIYFIYRFFIAKKKLNSGQYPRKTTKNDPDDYTDYEEIK